MYYMKSQLTKYIPINVKKKLFSL